MADLFLDCKGQRCPTPIVRIARQMAGMQSGQSLRVEATDTAFRSDLMAWLALKGERLLEFSEAPDGSVALLEKR